MVWAILPLVLGITYLIVLISKEKFGYSVPISVIVISLLLYFSQIFFSTFNIGIIGFVLFGLIGILFVILSMTGCIKTSRFNRSVELFFSPGFYGFIVVFLFALLAYGGRHFSSWDEMSHWGHMVKEMFRIDKFYIVPEARYMAHKDYPPIIQLFELLVCKFSGAYSEGKASTGIQLVLLSFLVPPMMEKIDGSKAPSKMKGGFYNLLIGVILLALTVLCFLWFDVSDVYRTIYNDCVTCAVAVYILGIALDKDIVTSKSRKIIFLITLFYFPLCKQISLAFILLAFFAVVISLIQYKGFHSQNTFSNIIFVISSIVVPIVSLKIWSHIIEPYQLGAQFKLGSIKIPELFRILLGKGSWVQQTTYMKYVSSLLKESITTGVFSLGYFTVGILAVFLLTLMYIFMRADSEILITRHEYIRYLLVFVAGIFGYGFTMFTMYMYGFTEGEMLSLASYPRYMATYTGAMFLILLGLFVQNIRLGYSDSKRRTKSYMAIITMLVLLLLLVDQNRLLCFIPKIYGNETREYQELASDIDTHVEYDDKVLLISNNNNMYYSFLRYYCNDAILFGNEYHSAVPNEEFDKFDYVYVINTNDSIDSLWSSYLADGGDSLQCGMYSIEFDNGEYLLRYIQ